LRKQPQTGQADLAAENHNWHQKRSIIMGKSMDAKKDSKKPAQKSLKEKRAEKKAKKEARNTL